jgi:hypothetical protein
MAIVNDPNALNDPSGTAALLLSLSTWLADPAVLTAIASLLTAVAAIFRTRQKRTAEPIPPQNPAPVETSLTQAYATLQRVEERFREELIQQLEHFRDQTESLREELVRYHHATEVMEDMILQCPARDCPTRTSLGDDA